MLKTFQKGQHPSSPAPPPHPISFRGGECHPRTVAGGQAPRQELSTSGLVRGAARRRQGWPADPFHGGANASSSQERDLGDPAQQQQRRSVPAGCSIPQSGFCRTGASGKGPRLDRRADALGTLRVRLTWPGQLPTLGLVSRHRGFLWTQTELEGWEFILRGAGSRSSSWRLGETGGTNAPLRAPWVG